METWTLVCYIRSDGVHACPQAAEATGAWCMTRGLRGGGDIHSSSIKIACSRLASLAVNGVSTISIEN